MDSHRTWEYFVVPFDMDDNSAAITRLLSDYGRGGWEVVAVMQPTPSVGGQWEYRVIMKRERRER